ncbi:hypothetical protein [Mycobacteroides abscessus]|uniref:hypothetical protein n=1 Tax=Mycobacteroides abscessus TaxID=36809 RepID=UPI00130000D4
MPVAVCDCGCQRVTDIGRINQSFDPTYCFDDGSRKIITTINDHVGTQFCHQLTILRLCISDNTVAFGFCKFDNKPPTDPAAPVTAMVEADSSSSTSIMSRAVSPLSSNVAASTNELPRGACTTDSASVTTCAHKVLTQTRLVWCVCQLDAKRQPHPNRGQAHEIWAFLPGL